MGGPRFESVEGLKRKSLEGPPQEERILPPDCLRTQTAISGLPGCPVC